MPAGGKEAVDGHHATQRVDVGRKATGQHASGQGLSHLCGAAFEQADVGHGVVDRTVAHAGQQHGHGGGVAGFGGQQAVGEPAHGTG